MISRLKKTGLGQAIYKLSRSGPLGWPVLMLSRAAQAESMQVAHLKPRHRKHNATQREILAAFERGVRK
ncbi:hypothetical protein JF540_24440 [Salipiger thiooxidans]|jgi:hypothetical protein|uniref:hypothetical protein n=1 Tax=Salipiger thiooxidans TaxID=282683 RepID=UPI001A8E9784|nr:hypothetical protein [Salipiger thiooxidans]MBN8189839.1 hypothetical protein [Salipiger thiooxidans]